MDDEKKLPTFRQALKQRLPTSLVSKIQNLEARRRPVFQIDPMREVTDPRSLRREAVSNPIRVLCYSPYTIFSMHSAWETLLLHNLHLRGHDVALVMCDGIYSQCDVARPNLFPRLDRELGPDGAKTTRICKDCKTASRGLLDSFKTPFDRISRYVTRSERAIARKWASSIETGDLLTAKYGEFEIGKWISSSVSTHFRVNKIDLDNPGIEKIARRYLESGLVACFALIRLFERHKPDLLLLFNGRMSSTRIALELARALGIRTVVEERGMVPGRIRFVENQNCLYSGYLDECWKAWKDIPLTEQECRKVTELLLSRRQGQAHEMRAFSSAAAGTSEVRRELNLDSRPIWTLFTSSADESTVEERAKGLFEDQYHWVDAVVDYAAHRPEIQLAIRVHPNSGSEHSIGRNHEDIAFFRSLAERAPKNVRIVQADSNISTYDLMTASSCGLVWHSSTGLEMAAMGKCVFRSGGMFFKDKEFLEPLADGHDFLARLDAATKNWSKDRAFENTKLALRFAYIWYFRQSFPFPLVSHAHWYSGEYDFQDAELVSPARTPELDLLVDIVLGNRPTMDQPGPDERLRTGKDEDEYMKKYLEDQI